MSVQRSKSSVRKAKQFWLTVLALIVGLTGTLLICSVSWKIIVGIALMWVGFATAAWVDNDMREALHEPPE